MEHLRRNKHDGADKYEQQPLHNTSQWEHTETAQQTVSQRAVVPLTGCEYKKWNVSGKCAGS